MTRRRGIAAPLAGCEKNDELSSPGRGPSSLARRGAHQPAVRKLRKNSESKATGVGTVAVVVRGRANRRLARYTRTGNFPPVALIAGAGRYSRRRWGGPCASPFAVPPHLLNPIPHQGAIRAIFVARAAAYPAVFQIAHPARAPSPGGVRAPAVLSRRPAEVSELDALSPWRALARRRVLGRGRTRATPTPG